MTNDSNRMKRIEYRGKHLRASRTGGVSIRAQTKAAGLNLTVNSRHGVRVSKRIAKGTNIALQNGRLRIQGRYGKGPTKLNLSKSGVTVSTKNEVGTFNWVKPKRSSATVAGINVRGKNALIVHSIWAVWKLITGVFGLIFALIGWLGRLADKPAEVQVPEAEAFEEDRVEPALLAALEQTEDPFQADTKRLPQALVFLGLVDAFMRRQGEPMTVTSLGDALNACFEEETLPPSLDRDEKVALWSMCKLSGDRLSEVAARIERDYPGEGRDVFAAHAAAFCETHAPDNTWLSHFMWLDDWIESQEFDEDVSSKRLWLVAQSSGVEASVE